MPMLCTYAGEIMSSTGIRARTSRFGMGAGAPLALASATRLASVGPSTV